MWSMTFDASTTAMICTAGTPNNLYIKAWHSTGEPTSLDRTWLFTYISMTQDILLMTAFLPEQADGLREGSRKPKKQSLSRVRGPRHFISLTYNAVLDSFHKQSKHPHPWTKGPNNMWPKNPWKLPSAVLSYNEKKQDWSSCCLNQWGIKGFLHNITWSS